MKAEHPLTDVEALKGSKSQPWMFGILVDRYQEPFLRKASYILRSHESAEDAVQETFLKIYKYGHQFAERESSSFNSWAYRILTNTCYDHASQKSRDKACVTAMDFSDLDAALGSSDLPGRERASFVRSVLARLPKNLARFITLYFFEEKTYKEIATSEDLSLSAVRSGLHRAKKRFKTIAIEMT